LVFALLPAAPTKYRRGQMASRISAHAQRSALAADQSHAFALRHLLAGSDSGTSSSVNPRGCACAERHNAVGIAGGYIHRDARAGRDWRDRQHAALPSSTSSS
jgi:hypothetical protein